MEVTPWEVSGDIDYEKLVRDFGVQPITDNLRKRIVKIAGEEHHFLRRNIFFAHTYLEKALDAIEKGKTVYLYTGRAPSGPVHIGHMVPWLFTRWLQEKLGLRLLFQIPDEEKTFFKDMDFEQSWDWTDDNILDIIATGFDHTKTDIVVDTHHAHLMYKTACEIAARTTANQAKALFGLNDSDNVGKYFYSCMQSVPCFMPSMIEDEDVQVLIPCAIDQDVHFRLTRDVAPKLGYPKPSTILCRFLPGLEGPGKMSTTQAEHAVINMTDDPKTIKKKVMKYAFSGGKDSIEEHREQGGDTSIDMAYQWLTFFEPDDKKLHDIKERYESGAMLSGEIKQELTDRLVPWIQAHQRRREDAKDMVEKFILQE